MPVPIAIRVNMLSRRLTSDAQPRSKNGHPPQRTTGVARASWIQIDARPSRSCRSSPGTISPIDSISSGTDRARLNQNRRVMSASSGSASSSAVTVIGSSAMPQIGHAPGRSRMISGCIGQVYSVPGGAAGSGAGDRCAGTDGFSTNRPGCETMGRSAAAYRAGSALNFSTQCRLQK